MRNRLQSSPSHCGLPESCTEGFWSEIPRTTINFHGQQILAKDKNTNEQLRNRVFETLDRQLNQLGYVAKEPQLQFINRTLNSEHTELEELTPNELQTAFTAILQARESNEIAA